MSKQKIEAEMREENERHKAKMDKLADQLKEVENPEEMLVDTLLLVWGNNYRSGKHTRYLSHIDSAGRAVCWWDGKTRGSGAGTQVWDNYERLPDHIVTANVLPNTGVKPDVPDGCVLLIKVKSNPIFRVYGDEYWSLENGNPITHYCLVRVAK